MFAFALGLAACAATPEVWVPVRWQGGPLELAWRAGEQTPAENPALREAIERWYDPATLKLLEGTPFNCLLVAWAGGGDKVVEARQQRLVAAYARTARRKGIAVVGIVYPGADPSSSARAAIAAGLDGLLAGGGAVPLPRWKAGPEPVFDCGGVPPRVKPLSEIGVIATPSGDPWIDSNMWLVRLLRTGSGPRPVWLGHALEKPAAEDYLRALAEATAAGGRWAVAPDDALRIKLLRGDPDALATWHRIAAYAKWFEERAEWRGFAPAGPVVVVHDAQGPQAEMSRENINLIARKQIPYRIVLRRELAPETLAGAAAVVATDLAPPNPRERALLEKFASDGGLLIAARSWSPPAAKGESYSVQPSGKGRIAVYNDDVPDPQALPGDLLELIGRQNAGLRLFNAASVLPSVSAREGRLLVQLVNYASAKTEGLTVRVRGAYRAARLYRPEAAAVPLALEKNGENVEVAVPEFTVYAALLFER